MDPDETLRLIRHHVRALLDPRTDSAERIHSGQALAEHFVDLDAWLAQGGFLPESWQRVEDRLPVT